MEPIPPAFRGRESPAVRSITRQSSQQFEVDVWYVNLNRAVEVLDRAAQIVSPLEQRAANAMAPPHGQRRLIARAALRQLLSTYTGTTPRDIDIVYGTFGKPELAVQTTVPPVHFNVSKSKSHCIIALCTGSPVGVDIERQDPIADVGQLARRVLHPLESSRVLASAEPAELRTFLRYWTAKEAHAKATGEGISLNWASRLVAPEVVDHEALAVPDHSGETWSLLHIDPVACCVGTLAVPCPLEQLTWRLRTFVFA